MADGFQFGLDTLFKELRSLFPRLGNSMVAAVCILVWLAAITFLARLVINALIKPTAWFIAELTHFQVPTSAFAATAQPQVPWIVATLLILILGVISYRWVRRKVAEMEARINAAYEQFTAVTWQLPSTTERARLIATLQAIGPHPIIIQCNENTDCAEFAYELAGAFESAGWYVLRTPFSGPYAVGIRGIFIVAKQEVGNQPLGDRLGTAIMETLGIGWTAHFQLAPKEDADIVLVVGPKSFSPRPRQDTQSAAGVS